LLKKITFQKLFTTHQFGKHCSKGRRRHESQVIWYQHEIPTWHSLVAHWKLWLFHEILMQIIMGMYWLYMILIKVFCTWSRQHILEIVTMKRSSHSSNSLLHTSQTLITATFIEKQNTQLSLGYT
jgi:hypothetical protein